ncbi:LCP family protein [Kocuria sp. ZOR0020]|uniref:LCP family protein n=1 Tax=Kocuria sp. ZOR0020 TaxID=1339234 RepID=UPI000648BC25|nr:LCP family protein [Kocuria sp. ZOR0020]
MKQSTSTGERTPWADTRQAGRHWSATAGRSRAMRWALISLAMGLVVLLGIGGLGIYRLQQNLRTSPLNLGDEQTVDDGPMDILIMGSDTRRGVGNEQYGEVEEGNGDGRTDVMMLLQISENRDDVTVVSFQRDLIVDIPECTDPTNGKVYEAVDDAMLNTAAENGGPGCTVATINKMTGLNIDHFMLADFNAVTELSSTVGGVEVCVNQAVDDPKSGLDLPAGVSTIEGAQALAFLRSRAAFGDGGDESRIRSQQQFMASLARKVKEEGTLTNPGKLYEIADVMTSNLHVDEQLGNITRIASIAGMMSGVDLSNVVFVTAPSEVYPLDPNRLQLDKPRAEELFQILREDGSLTDQQAVTGEATDTASPNDSASPADSGESTQPAEQSSDDPSVLLFTPGDIPIEVVDASETNGRAKELMKVLEDADYTQTTQGEDSSEVLPGTQILYGPGWQSAAQQVADELGIPQAQLVPAGDPETTVQLVIGQDFTEGDRMSMDSAVPEGLSGQTAEQFTCQQ